MPCQYYVNPEEEMRAMSDEWDEERKELLEETDKVTRLLCYVLRRIKGWGLEPVVVDDHEELKEWWEDHQEKDRLRQVAEERKQQRESEILLIDKEISIKSRELEELKWRKENL